MYVAATPDFTEHPKVADDRAVRHQQPVLVFKVADAASHACDHVIQHRDVFQMDSSTDQLERHGHALFKPENAIGRTLPCSVGLELSNEAGGSRGAGNVA